MNTYQNPIIPGFYPDPSICRVEEDYYLVNSSFEFFPGVPLWHSKDLVHWEQIGNVLTRESQLSLADCHTSGGIFAPTLRFHEGRFYMVTTNVSHGGNFYVWTDDIHGSWSDPIYVEQGGIDPSLFWDDDGTAYFISNQNNAAGKPIISQCVIDLATGKKRSPTKPLWGGTGGKCPEGPHMYKINGWYYLMIAEGGTEYGHMQTISRSRSPWGPFESCPRNPILSHRDISPADNAFQALGHSDLVEDPTGQWWIVFHAIRPTQFMLHHIGRETMLAPLTWDQDGWPLVNGGAPITNPMHAPQELTHLPAVPFVEQFVSPTLNPGWCFLRCPDKDCYSLSENPGSLTLKGSAATLDDLGSPTFLGRRQQQFSVCTNACVDIRKLEPGAQVGITVFHTNQHHYDIVIEQQGDSRVAFLRKRVVDICAEGKKVILPKSGTLWLRIDSDKLQYRFFVGTGAEALTLLGSGTSQLLSTECTVCTFTGCFQGMFAQGSATAAFRLFTQTPSPEPEE